MSAAISLDALDLAALLCSRVCHDLISPTGAIVNGLEVLEEEDSDEETKTFALDLIKRSAKTASARLQFCRLAFGAAGAATAKVDLGDAQAMAQGLHAMGDAGIGTGRGDAEAHLLSFPDRLDRERAPARDGLVGDDQQVEQELGPVLRQQFARQLPDELGLVILDERLRHGAGVAEIDLRAG